MSFEIQIYFITEGTVILTLGAHYQLKNRKKTTIYMFMVTTQNVQLTASQQLKRKLNIILIYL